MFALFRQLLLTALGVFFAGFGLYYAITACPDPRAFAAISRESSALGAVASFALAITLSLVGLILLLPLAWRLRTGSRRSESSASRDYRYFDRREEDYEEMDPADPEAFDPYEGHRRSGYEGYATPPSRNGRAMATRR